MKKDNFTLGVISVWIVNTIVNGLDCLIYTIELNKHPIYQVKNIEP